MMTKREYCESREFSAYPAHGMAGKPPGAFIVSKSGMTATGSRFSKFTATKSRLRNVLERGFSYDAACHFREKAGRRFSGNHV